MKNHIYLFLLLLEKYLQIADTIKLKKHKKPVRVEFAWKRNPVLFTPTLFSAEKR